MWPCASTSHRTTPDSSSRRTWSSTCTRPRTTSATTVRGVRAALAWSIETARLARQHNNANVVAIGVRQHTIDECTTLVDAFLDEPFSGDPRHQRRIDLVSNFEGR